MKTLLERPKRKIASLRRTLTAYELRALIQPVWKSKLTAVQVVREERTKRY